MSQEGVPAAAAVRGMTRRFGAAVAVDRVDLAVAVGEHIALVGPSGCGKSTLLHVLAGLQHPDEGVVEIGGRVVSGAGRWVPPEDRRVGLVFQDGALFPHLRVGDNVAFGLTTRARDRQRRVAELLELVGLGRLADRYPHELSGGQQQRVALARALAPAPRVVLLDEAFGNLDAALRDDVRSDTVAALRAAGTAAVFVTHDQEEALAVGQRVVVMHDGRIEQTGSPEEVYSRPATRYVANLLGEADLVPGERSGGTAHTELGPVLVEPGAAGPVDVVLRPHHVGLHLDAQGPGTVLQRQFRGSTVLYRVRLPSGAVVRSAQPPDCALPTGARVRVTAAAPGPAPAFARVEERPARATR